ncbi:MAG: GNAT family N-acetyltransferase [Bacteroidales bacterium]|nr:GNAT family N-acetyltransferase [Bacteroidales bacterium]
MTGEISLRVDRNPDFFSLLNKRGQSIVLVAEDFGNIVGCFSASQSTILINGIPEIVYYLADLKIDPSFERKTLTARLLHKMADHIRESGADLLFCTIAKGNEKVLPLFAGRLGFPRFILTGTFRVYQIIPLKRKIKTLKYSIHGQDINDEVLELYNGFYKRYQYSPVFSRDILQETRTFVARYDGNLVAALTVADMGSSKQNVLIKLLLVLRIIVSTCRLISRIIPLFNFPVIGEPVRVLYIRAFAFTGGRDDVFDALIRLAGNLAFEERYHYLAIGIHEKDSVAMHFTKYLHFTFNSQGFIVSMKGNKDKVNKIVDGLLYEDYSLV